jgi:AcrR family transcriptional regulator
VDAALEVIGRDGPQATVDAIASERGVSRQALYRQFDDRADLDRAIAQRAADELVLAVVPTLGLSGDLDASIRAALNAYLDHVEERLAVYRFVRAHEAAGTVVANVKDTVAYRVASIARDYLTQNGFGPAESAETFAVGVVGMADAVMGRWLADPSARPREEMVGDLVRMIAGVGGVFSG